MKWNKIEGGNEVFHAICEWNGYEIWYGHRNSYGCMGGGSKAYHLYKNSNHLWEARTQKECKKRAESMEEDTLID